MNKHLHDSKRQVCFRGCHRPTGADTAEQRTRRFSYATKLIPTVVMLACLLATSPAQAQLGQVHMGIYTVAADGSDLKELVHAEDRLHHGSPDWSPDGKRLVFDAYPSGLKDPAIYLVDADGTGLKQLGSGAYPRWSPDGERIVFFSGPGANAQVSVMKADGTGVRPLFAGAWPSWSPDGKAIVFSRDGAESGIWRAEANGSNPQQVLSRPGTLGAPVFSPDGESIAFVSGAGLDLDVYVTSSDGIDVRRLTSDPNMDLFPNWSPDGKSIAFTRYQGLETADVLVIGADGSGEHSLVTREGYDIDPVWSPDGKRIAFAGQR
jgi:Tol biopolymer transport system component